MTEAPTDAVERVEAVDVPPVGVVVVDEAAGEVCAVELDELAVAPVVWEAVGAVEPEPLELCVAESEVAAGAGWLGAAA